MPSVKTLYFLACSLTIFCSCITSHNAYSKQKKDIHIPRIQGEISVDADLTDPQWQHATKVSLDIVTRPYNNTKSPISTEALLMENGEVFYLAFVAQDPDPTQIRAFIRDRDKSWGDDIVGIKIDTFNDQRAAYRFLVNPMGSQIDGIENEVTQKESDAWDGIWDSAGRLTENGYIVEMALPLRMLNFKEKTSLQDWGIELMRFYPRNEQLRISNIVLDRNNSCELCQLHTATGFKGAKQGDNLIIAPSLVSGVHQEKGSNDEWNKNNNTEASLDLRWGITADTLLNATINPDFSTVETDNAQLNINNTFALYYDEKRPFFLDNADYFDTNYNLIYTRNINAPNYGAKLTGRHNNHTYALFVTDDDTTNILIPGNRSSSVARIDDKSNAAAIRYRYSYNKDITVGWVSTLRDAKNYHNAVHGIDARFKLSTYDVFKFQYLHSNTEYPDDLFQQFCNEDNPEACQQTTPVDCQFGSCAYNENVLRTQKEKPFSGNALRAGYYHNDEKWHYFATYDTQNAGFRGDLGFISYVDHNKFAIGGDRTWYGKAGSWWTQAKIYSDWDITHNDAGDLIEREFDINASINATYSSWVQLYYTQRDKVGTRHNKSILTINDNTTLFTEQQLGIRGNIKPILGLYLSANASYGDAIDYSNNRLGQNKKFDTQVNWNVNKHLEVRLKHIFNQLDADNQNVFNARLTELRTTYQFDVKSFLRFSFVYNNTNRNANNYLYTAPENITPYHKGVGTELLYAYKINPQTVFYLGYSDSHQAERNFHDLEQQQRIVFIKVSYAWIK
ncbi:carbohydrate binding family 9 domain-containing protein [Thalassotalea sp. PP2-459]|uniref:carbohydrate binding family 9 domain-containing protein n=1 Tax=Thalassotalea sp. PP2-459 TaxID=1742724 RepID=UPI0009458F91|nr:carbohydrate binding family 9 domain-containing protein [Thalassotalea sp. PP2-459]OKY25563.1 hypothetical protein BI291_16055 [Thalassotalea sp. PP2-459]